LNHTHSFEPATLAERRLADLIRTVHFGVIRNLGIQDGQPVFSPAPKIVRNIKFGACEARENAGARKPHKTQMSELFAALAEIGDGSIESLEVQSGLPFKLNIAYDYES
jgi:hypothetical protein